MKATRQILEQNYPIREQTVERVMRSINGLGIIRDFVDSRHLSNPVQAFCRFCLIKICFNLRQGKIRLELIAFS